MTEARRQFRHRRRGPANLNPKPALSAELRAKYLEPIIPWQMAQMPLGAFDGHTYGLLGTVDLIGYAAAFEVGIPWFTTQSPWLISLAPPQPWDPLTHRRHEQPNRKGVRGRKLDYRRALERRAKARPAIATIDRIELREKYQAIAAQYLAGRFRGYHSTPFPTPSTLPGRTNGAGEPSSSRLRTPSSAK